MFIIYIPLLVRAGFDPTTVQFTYSEANLVPMILMENGLKQFLL